MVTSLIKAGGMTLSKKPGVECSWKASRMSCIAEQEYEDPKRARHGVALGDWPEKEGDMEIKCEMDTRIVARHREDGQDS